MCLLHVGARDNHALMAGTGCERSTLELLVVELHLEHLEIPWVIMGARWAGASRTYTDIDVDVVCGRSVHR